MYDRIAVAIDGSATSYLALQEATKLAKEQKAKLCLILVSDITLPVSAGDAWVNFDEYEESIRKNSQDVLAKMSTVANDEGAEIESHLIEINEYQQRVPTKIIEDAQKWQADLLVIGTHGRRGFDHFLLGSVAEAIIRIAPMPILLIRGQADKKS